MKDGLRRAKALQETRTICGHHIVGANIASFLTPLKKFLLGPTGLLRPLTKPPSFTFLSSTSQELQAPLL